MTRHTRIEARIAREDGLTLVELAFAGLFLSVAIALALTLLSSAQNVVSRQQERSGNNDQARLAIQQLDREIRSGNLIYTPTAPFDNLLVFTQANAVQSCVQWRIT